ncbi:PREDICTED: uncharacterized protein LOC104715631 [Camelina sativa]|uniref:Uncharacterized protein LOC104715631 n=1 Tax=Camelina sativa TaxID=90675 RepID=A0ABM0TTV6_CAMSA|nr:PREDICTED: uncharacterized protein LOC104715631 [Camelina sativa]
MPTARIPPPFTPQEIQRVIPQSFRNFPPPQTLFEDTVNRLPDPPMSTTEVQNNVVNEPEDHPLSPLQQSHGHSRQPSSQGNNYDAEPQLQDDTLQSLTALLKMPGREQFTTILSPILLPKTTWFDRDKKGQLVRKITKIFTNKFDGPYYTWTCVPPDRKERYFIEFAKTHTWDPLITGAVQEHFNSICNRRMKGMVSDARTSGVKPTWIEGELWKEMVANWDTEEQQQRSSTYSKCRMSDRNGLGPHIHLSGPKSYREIQDDLEEELGREVSMGEVFYKTHTKPDGSYVDGKAEKIHQAYQQKLQEKMAELEADSTISDGTSHRRELTTDECTAIFLECTEKDSRGTPYGVGSLKDTLGKGKGNQPSQTEAFLSLQEQLKEAQRQIEVQAEIQAALRAEAAAREKETALLVAEQKQELTMMAKFMRHTNPAYLEFITSQTAEEDNLPSTTP